MNDGRIDCTSTETGLLACLSAFLVDYRQALAILDPEYHEWRPEGKPKHRLDHVAGVPLLTAEPDGVCYLLGELSDASAPSVARFVSERDLNELHVFGDEPFRRLKAHLSNGQWRGSRNYEATAGGFLPRPCRDVRVLQPEDRGLLEAACEVFPAIGGSRSTMRDFNYMANGLPAICCGAIVDRQLVGFCSANPICRGVTEISWIVVAEGYRRRGVASGLLTAQADQVFARGHRAAYYAGSAGADLHVMLIGLGFREAKGSFRFVPASARDQWRTAWGIPV
jgi:GNAT superfamily N-acetyltransferase